MIIAHIAQSLHGLGMAQLDSQDFAAAKPQVLPKP